MNVNVSSFSRRETARLVVGAALLLAGLGAPLGAYAQSDEVTDAGFSSGQTAVVADGPLNLRSGPGLGSSVIETLSTGAYVEIQSGPTNADGYSWYQVYVDASGNVGYVAGSFLASVSGGSFSIGDSVYVDTGALNVRSGPGVDYAVIDTIGYGTNGLVVDGPVFASGYVWYELNYVGGSADGWVAGDFLSLSTSGGGAFAIGDTVSVTSNTLNIRSGPGLSYATVGSFAYGDQGVVLDGPSYADGYSWYQLQYGGIYSGWVAGEYLGYVTGSFSIGDNVYATANGLNVRSGAGLAYAVIGGLSYGETGTVTDGPVYSDGYAWYQLSYDGSLSGWVAAAYLARS